MDEIFYVKLILHIISNYFIMRDNYSHIKVSRFFL